jgi:ribosomal protein S18 acetylase RimI-like enzyme
MAAFADSIAPVSYFKRYKMEIGLRDVPRPELPAGLRWVAWQSDALELHAEALFAAFYQEIDAEVFPSLGNRHGCSTLMNEIACKSGFEPEATWLVVGPDGPCATIQGIRERGAGAIQNVGVAPGWRGRGIGAALVLQALDGFARIGLGRALLEVTAGNDAALRLYRRLGFRRTKTLYKAVTDPRWPE